MCYACTIIHVDYIFSRFDYFNFRPCSWFKYFILAKGGCSYVGWANIIPLSITHHLWSAPGPR